MSENDAVTFISEWPPPSDAATSTSDKSESDEPSPKKKSKSVQPESVAEALPMEANAALAVELRSETHNPTVQLFFWQ